MAKIYRVLTATPSGMVYARETHSPAAAPKDPSPWDDDQITTVRESPAAPTGRKTWVPV